DGCGVRGSMIMEHLFFYHRQVGSRLESGKLHALSSYKRMRTRHPRFYRGSPFLRAQRQGYYDCWAYPPLLNLSRADQYNAVISDAVAVVADGPLTEDWNAWRRQFDELPASSTVFVIAGGCRKLPGWLLERASAIYWLDDLLHERQWSAFIDNFRRTRGISKVFSVGRTAW
ncbi:hypothetical protein, partial [Pseudomonas aeruginosa]|uniref:hypothetical protein n=1 Tax=Pseudomonas aeruginosa TaxID=287 RepID=UPI0023592BAC